MPALGLLVSAVVALLIALGWSGWTVKVLQSMKASAPGLFGPLFDALIGADAAIYNRLRSWTDPAIQPFSDFLGRVTAGVESLTQNPLAFAQATYGALWRAFNVAIPGAITTAEATAQGLFQTARGEAQTLFSKAEADLQQAGVTLQAGLLALQLWLQQLGAYAQQLFAQAEQDLAATASRVEAEIGQAVGQEAGRAQAEEARIAQGVTADLSQLVGEVQAGFRGLEAVVNQDVGDLDARVRAARDFMETEIAGFEKLAQDEIDKVLASGPWAGLVAQMGTGEALLKSDVQTLVMLGAAAIRKQLKDVDSIRARFAPEIEKAGKALVK